MNTNLAVAKIAMILADEKTSRKDRIDNAMIMIGRIMQDHEQSAFESKEKPFDFLGCEISLGQTLEGKDAERIAEMMRKADITMPNLRIKNPGDNPSVVSEKAEIYFGLQKNQAKELLAGKKTLMDIAPRFSENSEARNIISIFFGECFNESKGFSAEMSFANYREIGK